MSRVATLPMVVLQCIDSGLLHDYYEPVQNKTWTGSYLFVPLGKGVEAMNYMSQNML